MLRRWFDENSPDLGARTQDMLFIFKDERREAGLFSSNPERTRHLLPVDIVTKCLKWATLRLISRLATGKNWGANAATLIENAP